MSTEQQDVPVVDLAVVSAGTDGPSAAIVAADAGLAVVLLEAGTAVGEASARVAAGVGYDSGYSLSRAMAYGCLAVHDILQMNGGQVAAAATRGEA